MIVDLDTGIGIADQAIEFNPDLVARNRMVAAPFLDDDAVPVVGDQISLPQRSCANSRVTADGIVMGVLPQRDGGSIEIDDM